MLFFTPQLGQDARLVGHEDVYQVVRVNHAKTVVDLALPGNESIVLRNIRSRDLKKRSPHFALLGWLKTQFADEFVKGRLTMIITVPLSIGLVLLVELKKLCVQPPEVMLKQMSSAEFLADAESVSNKILSKQASSHPRKRHSAVKE